MPSAHRAALDRFEQESAASVEPAAFARSVARYGYHVQAAFYTELVVALGLAEVVEFVFVAQAKNPPYLVQAYSLDAYSLALGMKRVRQAIDLFAECTANGHWPSYGDGVVELTIPVYADDDDDIVIGEAA